ncbi:MAG: hypothetical protein FWD28_01735 [Treponema sp.]|nr:hypothetical protein [Treponema sp.]
MRKKAAAVKNIIIPLISGFMLLFIFNCASISIGGVRVLSRGPLIVNEPSEEGVIATTDILINGFFWVIRQWKDGKLATVDGWGRFAEISFESETRVTLRTLMEYPRSQQDNWGFLTWPEAGLMVSKVIGTHFLADINNNITKTQSPMGMFSFYWANKEGDPVLLDAEQGIIAYVYNHGNNGWDRSQRSITATSLYIYDYKNDTMIFESPELHSRNEKDEKTFTLGINAAINNELVLAYHRVFYDDRRSRDNFLYNWRTREIIRNDLTNAINKSDVSISIDPFINFNANKRILIGSIGGAEREHFKIDWDENFSNVKITNLSYLIPAGQRFAGSFIFSSCGSWATTQIYGSLRINGKSMYKRAFFHIDEKYPNGISEAIYGDDYEEYDNGFLYNAFVNHPIYGWCLAQKGADILSNKRAEYLRLYKMEDVLAEIDKRQEK